MKKQAWLILCIIALVAGFALAATNLVTAGPIEEQRIKATQAARIAVFPEASNFEEMQMESDTGLDSVYIATSGTDTLGYVLQITVPGYGGPIEIIMGVDMQGTITGLTVGGSNFAETAGLGTQVKEPPFTDQFVGLREMPAINENVDTISGATISSSAVINGVIRCYKQWEVIIKDTEPISNADSSASTIPATNAAPLYADGVFLGEADGFIGPIRVSVSVENGVIKAIKVLATSDTQALFAMARDSIVPEVVRAGSTAGVDTVSGATYSSQGLLNAIDNALCSTCGEKAEASTAGQYLDGVFIGEAQGYTGTIKVAVTVVGGAINAVRVVDQQDTDAIFAMARNTVIPAILAADGTTGVDTVSGATYSSQGILDAVNNALSGGIPAENENIEQPRMDGEYTGDAQGFMSNIKVAVTLQGGNITAIKVLEQGDTAAIFARAQEHILPAVLQANGTDGVDTVSGATYSSQGLLDAINEALCGDCAQLVDANTDTGYTDGVFTGQAQGYMGTVRLAVTVTDGTISDIKVLESNDTEAIFAAAKDAVIPAVIAANAVNGVDTLTGATYSSLGILNAIDTALQQPAPMQYSYTDGVYEGEGQGYQGAIKVSVTIESSAITGIEVLESGDNPTMFSLVADAIIPDVLGNNSSSGVDAIADATFSSQGLLDAIADALAKATVE